MFKKLSLVIIAALLSGYANAQEGPSTEQVLGAIAGGALGSTIGDGDGRKAATVIGAIIGYRNGDRLLGHRHQHHGNYQPNTIYHMPSQSFIREECRRMLPLAYEHEWNLRHAWIDGCVKRTYDKIYAQRTQDLMRKRELERRAFLEGYENYTGP